MNQKEQIVCYLCQTKENLILVSQDYGICPPCRAQQIEQMKYYKSIRQKSPQIDQIDQGLYLGNQDAATSKEIVDKYNIRAICVCGDVLDTQFIEDKTFEYKIYLISDYPSQSIKQYFDENFEWMMKMKGQNRNILLHCAAGISRSASFTIAFLMRWKKMYFVDAKAYVKDKRKYIHPNSGFVRQLQQYEEQLIYRGILAEKVEELEQINPSN